jgi:hypothetical protein
MQPSNIYQIAKKKIYLALLDLKKPGYLTYALFNFIDPPFILHSFQVVILGCFDCSEKKIQAMVKGRMASPRSKIDFSYICS